MTRSDSARCASLISCTDMHGHSQLATFVLLTTALACAHLPAVTSEVPLRVMTYNIRSGNGNLDGIAAAIRASAPDLVGLQEVDVHWAERSNFADQATSLGEQLKIQVCFVRIYQLPGGRASDPPREFGVALLSKYPIVAWTNHAITRLSTQSDGAAPAPLPGFLEATVDVRGTRVRVFNTHLDYRPDPAVRRQQVTETLAIIGDPATPTLLFGDMNAGPSAPELQPLFERLHDSWAVSADAGLTHPATTPVKRIDYVLASKHFRVLGAWVADTQASDHRPVVVDLAVGRTPD